MSNRLCQACGNPDNHHERGGPTCIQKCERGRLDLEAAKQRERELQNEMVRYQHEVVAPIQQQRDAALSTLAELVSASNEYRMAQVSKGICSDALIKSVDERHRKAIDATTNPSAALAERDRAIEKRTAEKCLEMAGEEKHTYRCNIQRAIIREFGLSDDRWGPNTD